MTEDTGIEQKEEDEGQPLDPEHYKLMSNAGRCDICGKIINMDDGDELQICEFDPPHENVPDHITGQDIADEVSRALESVAETAAGRELARVIREDLAFAVHGECLDETNYSKLPTENDL